MLTAYSDNAPQRDSLDAASGPLVLEFGNNGCGICQAALPLIEAAMQVNKLPHLRIQDGKGRRLGRSYGIKLWPTLVLLHDGRQLARVVRPTSMGELAAALQLLAAHQP